MTDARRDVAGEVWERLGQEVYCAIIDWDTRNEEGPSPLKDRIIKLFRDKIDMLSAAKFPAQGEEPVAWLGAVDQGMGHYHLEVADPSTPNAFPVYRHPAQGEEPGEVRAYSILSSYGISKERARSVANGIMVLATRFEREIAALRASRPAPSPDTLPRKCKKCGRVFEPGMWAGWAGNGWHYIDTDSSDRCTGTLEEFDRRGRK